MDFLYADELKQRYQVWGHYYDLNIAGEIFPCRSVANILNVDCSSSDVDGVPDAVVIMMNPGSSKPALDNYQPKSYSVESLLSGRRKKEFTPVKPDSTQYQIMRLMALKEWRHARILNLSDLRDGNSGSFAKAHQRAYQLDPSGPHSLLNPKRYKELRNACEGVRHIIAAWGSNKVQVEEAKDCIAVFDKEAQKGGVGLKGLPLEYPWFRFASPYRKDHKLAWLVVIGDLV